MVADWRSALDVLQRSQPFFSVCIEPNNGDMPFFRHVDGAAIPLRVVDGMSGPRWQEEMAWEIFTPFAGDAAPLLRATLIHEANRAVFILAAHHTISDGVSMAAALCDLFHVLAGGTIETHPVIPPMEESLGVPRAQPNEPLDAPPPAGPPLVYRGPDINPPRIETLKLDAALTNQLVARAGARTRPCMARCVLRSCAPAGCLRRLGARSLSAFSRTSTSAGTRELATAPPYISPLESHPSGPKTLRSFGRWHGVSRTLCRRSDPGGPFNSQLRL
jgi:hypothetical protein